MVKALLNQAHHFGEPSAAAGWYEFDTELTQADMASMVSATRVSVTITVMGLRREGLLKGTRGHYLVNMEGMEALLNGCGDDWPAALCSGVHFALPDSQKCRTGRPAPPEPRTPAQRPTLDSTRATEIRSLLAVPGEDAVDLFCKSSAPAGITFARLSGSVHPGGRWVMLSLPTGVRPHLRPTP